MDEAARGASAIAAADFPKAIKHYNTAIESNPQAVNYYIQRSIAHVRVSPADHASSFKDAEMALALASKRGSRGLMTQSQLRRGVALFGLERWADAQECFKWVGKLDPKEKTVKIWEIKAQGKLKGLAEDDEKSKVRVKELPDVELPKEKIAKKVEKPAAQKESPLPAPTAKEAGTEVKPEGVQTPANKIRHEWYQTVDNVVVTLFAKGIPKDKATVEILQNSISISFPLPTGSDFHFSLDPLFANIDLASSAAKIMSTKVEFTLKKSILGQKWPSLEATELPADGNTESQEGDHESSTAATGVLPSRNTSSVGPSYPTSSKSGPKDWDKLANDLVKKPKKNKKDKKDGDDDEEDDGIDDMEDGDPVNGFFQQLYKNSDPDTRRAMMKSYSESNGTALSTDWSSVSKAPVETSPPDGMEAKKW